MVNGMKDYEFQNECVEFLIDKTVDISSKQVITVKAPTGAGKTVILIKYVDEYLKNTDGHTAFVWLCPGKGNLEEQSKNSMENLTSQRDTRNLMYSMLSGFEPGSVTFINWELVTKKGNTALKDSERSNLFEKIAEAHKDGTKFVVIIDEEHLNNTKKADEKRKEIAELYKRMKISIRPLVLIQFPMGQPETIKAVEDKLSSMGYTYDNGMVNIWMSDEKIVGDDLTNLDGSAAFLLMKQAISTGWDCPRAKILIKLREGGSEDFQIQTIGRIRRMPEGKHYGINTLDYCYIYTLDTNYKMGLLSSLDKAYQVRRLFLKDEAKELSLVKELRDLDFDGLGERETLIKVYEHFKEKYNLGGNKNINRENLEAGGYNFSHEIDSKILQGIFKNTEELANGDADNRIKIKTTVNTHSHGIYLLHSVDAIKKVTGMQSQKVKNILRRMFSKGKRTKYKFVALENADFYAFIINNVPRLKMDFKEVTSGLGGVQMSLKLEPKTTTFTIPEMEIYKYSEVKKRTVFRLNAYKEYTNEFIVGKLRSEPERLFERYCERNENVQWFYKNGDAGQQYLSVVYVDVVGKQWLFYPDYVVHMKDGTDWIIETKGGEVAGHSKNIDTQVVNKFNAFKNYAEKYHLKWGFVRDESEDLFINNTEYVEDMADEHWVDISEAF